jgi:glucosylceramidase
MKMRITTSLALLGASILGVAACSSPTGPAGDASGSGGSILGLGGTVASGGATSGGTLGAVGGSLNPGTGGAQSSSGGAALSSGGSDSSSGGSGEGAGGTDPGAGGSASGGASPGDGGSPGTGGGAPIVEPSFVTSAPNNYWKVSELMPGSGTASITVNDTQVLGEWHGFGGTFNEKGWEAMKALSQADRDKAISLLFDRADGAAFTYGRIPIGSSDYALNRYSLNETAGDFQMTNFSLERDRKDLIPYIKAALDVQPDIHFWASPWSPPTWMKSNNAFDRGNMKEDDATLGAHALYLAKFVEEYAKEGIIVEAVHPQNEPGYLQDYPSCGWSPNLMTKYIRDHLGPLFAERLPSTEIWMGTLSAPADKTIADTVMTTPAAAEFISGLGTQWGQDVNVPGYISAYNKPVMQTEHRCGNFPSGGASTTRAPNDDAYARESWGYIKTYITNGVSSYMAWNMVLDTGGVNIDTVRPWAQNALLAVDVPGKRLIITPVYYVFRHLAQFVDEGSSRVAIQPQNTNGLAWKNKDGDVVVVLYNGNGSASNQTVSVGGNTYQVTIPGQGWATLNVQAP